MEGSVVHLKSDLEAGNGKMSLRRCEFVGDKYPCQGEEVEVPAEGVWRGLKSEEGDAEDIKDECEISVDPSTLRAFGVGLVVYSDRLAMCCRAGRRVERARAGEVYRPLPVIDHI